MKALQKDSVSKGSVLLRTATITDHGVKEGEVYMVRVFDTDYGTSLYRVQLDDNFVITLAQSWFKGE